MHAYRPDGSELPGWPVKTQTQFSATEHLASPALRELEPPLEPPRGPTIADLTGDGRPEVITAAGERLYVWDGSGDPLPGWPVRPDPGAGQLRPVRAAEGDQAPQVRVPGDAGGGKARGPDQPLAIVAPGLDGRLRAYRPDGTPVPGFPVRLIDPDLPADQQITAESINNPAIGDLDGDGRDDIVIATNEVYGGGGGGGDVSFGDALAPPAPPRACTRSSRAARVRAATPIRSSLAGRSSPAASSRTCCRWSGRATTRRW